MKKSKWKKEVPILHTFLYWMLWKIFFFILYDQVITSLLLYMMYIKPKSHRDFLVVLWHFKNAIYIYILQFLSYLWSELFIFIFIFPVALLFFSALWKKTKEVKWRGWFLFCFGLFCCVLKEADQLLIISSQDEFAVKDYGNSRVKTSTVLSIPWRSMMTLYDMVEKH